MKRHVLPVVALHAHHAGVAAREVVKDVEENAKAVVKMAVKINVLAIVVEVAMEDVVGHAKVDVKQAVATWREIMKGINKKSC